jgi:hypothetical protein
MGGKSHLNIFEYLPEPSLVGPLNLRRYILLLCTLYPHLLAWHRYECGCLKNARNVMYPDLEIFGNSGSRYDLIDKKI